VLVKNNFIDFGSCLDRVKCLDFAASQNEFFEDRVSNFVTCTRYHFLRCANHQDADKGNKDVDIVHHCICARASITRDFNRVSNDQR
jgi:hypothetical protein